MSDITHRQYRSSVFASLVIFCLWGVSAARAETLKRRVLVLPFDNLQNNKNFNWMSDSMADNLKAELLKTDRYEVLDVTLLRKIDAGMQFANLTPQNAAAFAKRLNCEVAVIGRFSVSKKDQQQMVRIEAEAVDALEDISVVTKNEETATGGEIFDTLSKLALNISDELNQKLRPLDASEFKRDNKLELLIYRLEHPPKGFLDSLSIKNLVLRPAFDIDRYEYDVYLNYEEAAENKTIRFTYEYLRKRLAPYITTTGLKCTGEECVAESTEPVLNLAYSEKPDAIKYTVRIHYPDPRGPVLARWWVTAGYPYMTSLSVAGMSNPAALTAGSGFTFDAMRGYATLEAGILPGRWQFLPAKMRWALATQYTYGSGDAAQYLADNPTKARISLLSIGGGLRFDRPFDFGKRYSLSPVIGVYVQYQNFFRDLSSGAYSIMAINPEIGLNQYYRLGQKSPWHLMLSLMAGSYLYQGQNLTYFRASLGVEYVIK